MPPMPMGMHGIDVGLLSILLMLLLLLVVWLLRVVPVRKLQLHVCYPAGLGREWNVPREKLGIYYIGKRDEGGRVPR